MKRIILICLVGTVAFVQCKRVPLTGRKQLNLIPEREMVQMAGQEYRQFLTQNKVVSTTAPPSPDAAMVTRVGQKLANAATIYLTQKGLSKQLEGYKWEFNLVQSNEVNAWCMPGGKVVVYTGILPLTQNETGLAVVLGHEISHAIARHGNERMSQGLLAQTGSLMLNVALSQKPEQTRAIFNTAYNLGAQYGALLPYSRFQELEADKLGLYFMAMAGYDPNQATDFWNRMSKMGGNKPPTFMSTHPSDDQRILEIRKELPKVMPYYKK